MNTDSTPSRNTNTRTTRTGRSQADTPDPERPRSGGRFRVLAYMRVSRDEAVTGSHTFETQETRIREKLDRTYGSGRYDLLLIKDDGISGGYGLEPMFHEKKVRPELKRVQEELATGQYDAIAVYKLNRLVRGPQIFYQLLEKVFYPAGVRVLSATEDLDLGTPMGRAVVGMIAIIDGLFRDNVIERNKDAALTRAQLGYLCGRPCYGWEWEEKALTPANRRRRIVPVPEQERVLREMWAWYEAGWSAQKIARVLNERGVPSPSGKDRWWDVQVFKVLFSPLHTGFVPSAQGLQRGDHFGQRFWEAADLERLQQLRETRQARFPSNTAHEPAAHLLAGLVFCARCGKRLYVHCTNGAYRNYRCMTGQGQGQGTCQGLHIRADALEKAVIAQLERLAQEPAMQAYLLAEAAEVATGQDAGLVRDQAQWHERVAKLEGQQARLLEKLSEGVITDAEFAGHNEKLRSQLEEARQHRAQAEQGLSRRQQREAQVRGVQEAVLDFPRAWGHLSADERREVLSQLVEGLTVDRAGRDFLVRLKVCLLPEQEVTITIASAAKLKQKPTGPEAVTPRQLALLHHVGQGKTRAAAAAAMGVSDITARGWLRQIKKHVGTSDLADAFVLCRGRISLLLGTLPLGPNEEPRSAASRERDAAARLTPKLREILPFLLQGATNPEIARLTGLTKSTVANRRNEITKILGTFSIYEIGQKVKELGIEVPGGN